MPQQVLAENLLTQEKNEQIFESHNFLFFSDRFEIYGDLR